MYITKLLMLGKFALGMSLIVGIHELGHMLLAKLFGMRVDQYMIGFPPKIVRFVKGETEYALGAIPFGGFVKIAGMVDESMDTDYLHKTQQPWEFRSKPVWQRACVMLGGILFNLISAWAIYVCILLATGIPYLSQEAFNKHGIYTTAISQKLGFHSGDKIIQINGQGIQKWSEIAARQQKGETLTYRVARGKAQQTFDIKVNSAAIQKNPHLIEPLVPFSVQKTIKGQGAALAGLQPKDRIIAINGASTPYLQYFKTELTKHKGKVVTLTYLRQGKQYTTTLKVNKEGRIGILVKSELVYAYASISVPKALGASLNWVTNVLMLQAKGIAALVSGKVSLTQVSGPIGIAGAFGQSVGFLGFLLLIALLSVLIAFMNLLPIPGLDGGHVFWQLSYELITGKPLPEHWQVRLQKVGMLLILSLMALAVLSDMYRFVK